MRILSRQSNPAAASFASEIVSCGFDDGSRVRLFCKYGPLRHDDGSGRRGVGYEADVYRHLLATLPVDTAPFYGEYRDAAANSCWLVLGHIHGGVHAHKAASQAGTLKAAARWIGRFHSLTGRLGPGELPGCLERYDGDHYAKWAWRTDALAQDLHEDYPWLRAACAGYVKLAPHLVSHSTTVVHGDYYPDNILLAGGRLWPIDWEWAAVGAGEIDLAALTFRWPPELAEACEAEYARARWGTTVPLDYPTTLTAARLYLCFRYMGISPEFMRDERRRWRFHAVRELSQRLGLGP